MNKKLNMMGLIEKGKLDVVDGIVINLDTGLIFGGAVKPHLNEIAMELNQHWDNNCKQVKEEYKLFERMIQGRSESQAVINLWAKIEPLIQNTQLYCYHYEKSQL
eukprot:GHVR01141973.1.p1 GENE.GHVR01141973.1~~GHVR01141973.1.p1  ORF type:complete len:105 (+),score=9.83 GHVR01141973.1:729-1043(+)